MITDFEGVWQSECFPKSFAIYKKNRQLAKYNFVANVDYSSVYDLFVVIPYKIQDTYSSKYTGQILILNGKNGQIKKKLKVLAGDIVTNPGSKNKRFFSKDKIKYVWEIDGQRIVLDLKSLSYVKTAFLAKHRSSTVRWLYQIKK